jgi:1-acyl-sn-glycerol-3-phosphate acyltransferase
MKRSFKIVNAFLRFVFRRVCRIDPADFRQIPVNGPLILVGNHINFLEIPVFLPHVNHPNVTGIAKRESWKNPLFNFLFNLWGGIPIDRGTVDRDAIHLAEEALNAGKVLAISPEGTRSKDGKLLPGKPGVVLLAYKTHAPLLPVAFHGYEEFWKNLKRFQKTDFHLEMGQPFTIDFERQPLSRDVRQRITDEIMFKIAELLPEKYRGHYQFEQPVNYQFLVDDLSLMQKERSLSPQWQEGKQAEKIPAAQSS